MAVATKTTPDAAVRDPVRQLAVGSLLGALYLLLSLGFIFGQLPILWEFLGIGNAFLSESLLLIVTLAVIVGLVYLGKKLEGPHPQTGLRAGSFVAAVGLFLTLLISLGFGNWQAVTKGEPTIGLILAVVLAGLMLGGLAWLFLQPAFARLLVRFEEGGWFYTTQFKANQGVRVRRGTFISLLVLIAFGIITLVQHRALTRGAWQLDLLDSGYALYLLFSVNILGPVLILLVLGWISWRVVNWPVFADFLIATEAELNKVSWTTRRRLVQDTVVVLVTVALMALFLFAVDYMWIRVLTFNPIRVLQVDLQQEKAKQQTQQDW